jgi:hypothetical protein
VERRLLLLLEIPRLWHRHIRVSKASIAFRRLARWRRVLPLQEGLDLVLDGHCLGICFWSSAALSSSACCPVALLGEAATVRCCCVGHSFFFLAEASALDFAADLGGYFFRLDEVEMSVVAAFGGFGAGDRREVAVTG